MPDRWPRAREVAPLGAALAAGFGLQLWRIGALDLSDLPGPGGLLLVRDLYLGQASQGPASWLGQGLVALGLGPQPAARALMGAAYLGALLGAGLAARALAGTAAGVAAILLGACWSLASFQGWLLDPGTPAWGLAWLGLGLAWAACARRRHLPAGLGAALLVLGVAIKPNALPVLGLLPLGPWLSPARPGGRRALLAALGLGAGLGLLPAVLLQAPDQPWLPGQALAGPRDGPGAIGALLTLPERGLAVGDLPLLCGLAAIAALTGARRRPLGLAILGLTAAALLAVAATRGDRLQPRHLLPACLGLLVLVATLVAPARAGAPWSWRRALPAVGLGLLGALALLDGLAFAGAWSAQRTRYAQTAPARLPAAPAFLAARHEDPPWTLFFESSLAGSADLLRIAGRAEGGLLGVPLQERRDALLEIAALDAGRPYRLLARERCCDPGEPLGSCAERVLDQVAALPLLLVLPGKAEAAGVEERAWVEAMIDALRARGHLERERWYTWRGAGTGDALPCRPPRGPGKG